MKYGAYYDNRQNDIVWFRTQRSMASGYYHRHFHHNEPPDVYLADSVPDLIMNSFCWLDEAEVAFQREHGSPNFTDDQKRREKDQMTENLVQRLDPHDPTVWVDEPHWLKHLKAD